MSSRNCIDTGLTVSVSVLHSHFMGFNVISRQNLSFFVMIPFSSRVLCYFENNKKKKAKAVIKIKWNFRERKKWEIFFVFLFSFSSSSSSSSSSWLQYSFRKAFLFWTKNALKKRGNFIKKKIDFFAFLFVCVCKNTIFII